MRYAPKKKRENREVVLALVIGVLLVTLGVHGHAHAATARELENKIAETRDQIADIDAEIKRYEQELTRVGGERSTLENAIAELNLTRKKLLSDISLTQKRIEQTTYSIENLNIEIKDKEDKIALNSEVLAEGLRTIHEADNQTFVETLLANEDLTTLWTEIDQLEQVQDMVRDELLTLQTLKEDLLARRNDEQKEHENLSTYKKQLSGQQQVIEENTRQKDVLLTQTKSEEAKYQQLLAEKRAAAKKFESELQDYEAQLEYIRDPSKLPREGTAALGWPVESPTLTQGFGLTSFARAGSYGYDAAGNPNPHRGVDFRASVGTPVLAAAAGTVRDAVNMDAVPGCYSYGRWILVDHDNGLSTLYAHLSVMSVSAGEYVKKGQIIGYAGNSGYATGPHLHFTVFDRDAVKVALFTWSNGCKGTKIAYAPYDAYLDPMSYLPQ